MIAAEIRPADGKAEVAARELQHLGFRVHHVGDTVSVDADEALWSNVFGARFEDVDRKTGDGPLPAETFRRVVKGTLRIPPELRTFIDEVALIEPPEFF